jgi:hypothetical protein
MRPQPCIIGLDEPQIDILRADFGFEGVAFPSLPRVLVRDGLLWVESPNSFRLLPISSVIFHGIFEHDLNTFAALALWGGPCLPNPRAMMDCRLKLPCLVRALSLSSFASPPRGFASAGLPCPTHSERVAKWGNWHCGENKARFSSTWTGSEDAIIEPFLPGDAVRVVVIGDQHWQINLSGDSWLKSIHHPDAQIVPPTPSLVADTIAVGLGFGLSILANDYIVSPDGSPHLLEVNHIPNVTRFPPIWDAYAAYISQWLSALPPEP